MKAPLAILSLLFCGVLSEAPYPPSGWRPSGPSFDLPERNPVDPRNRNAPPQKQEYLPPRTPTQAYGPPEVDVSVQGLPTDEQLPIFQLSPVNGQQYAGPNFNRDLQNLGSNLNQQQLQAQRDIYKEFARQRELEAAYARANANRAQPVPRQFVPSSTTPKPDDAKSTVEPTTTEVSLNQREVKNDDDNTTVEVTKQKVQEYPPEFFFNQLSRLQSQNQQFAPVQLGQLRAPIFLEPTQRQVAYSPAQLLAQQQFLQLQQSQLAQAQIAQAQLSQAQLAQAQAVQPQPQLIQPQYLQPQQTTQQGVAPSPAYLIPQDQTLIPQSGQPDLSQYQPGYDVQAQYPQQTIFLQPQPNQLLPQPQDQQVTEQDSQLQSQGQPQLVYQYQYPSEYQQPQQQPLNSYQQPQLIIQDPSYQQFPQSQLGQQVQGQGSLQSGLDANQPSNGIDQTTESDDDEDDGSTATAVATAFGTRTQPRVYPTYGTPVPVPRVQARPGYQYPSSSDANTQEATTDDGPATAEATAVTKGGRRPAKLRSRQSRLRPVFTLDKSGHLVLAQDQ